MKYSDSNVELQKLVICPTVCIVLTVLQVISVTARSDLCPILVQWLQAVLIRLLVI